MQTDKQMASKWVDGQKGKESSSQTDRKTDGKLTGRQTDGQDDKWDVASQTDLEAWRQTERQTECPANILSFSLGINRIVKLNNLRHVRTSACLSHYASALINKTVMAESALTIILID